MNQESENLGKETGKGPRNLRLWLILVAATFLVLLMVTQFLPGGRRSFSDWMQPLLFLFGVSVAAATAFLGVWVVGRWVCRWRILKRVLLVGACLIALVALFYAEEDWRGWHAWTQFKHKWEARGEQFSLARVVPPPVPDEQNFALTPIAFTSYGQLLTREGKLIPAEKRDEHFVLRMRMPVTLGYTGATNCAGDRVRERSRGWSAGRVITASWRAGPMRFQSRRSRSRRRRTYFWR